MIYTIRAAWPNAAADPYVMHVPHVAEGLDCALRLAATGKHTTISVLTPDGLELIRLWGQPMPNGQPWP